jgi:hypothetical protein
MYRILLITMLLLPPLVAAREVTRLAASADDRSHIDYDAMDKTITDIARENPAHPRLIEAETYTQTQRFSREAEKGARKDCKTAYAGLSLLAIPFLVYDTLTKTGCKW